MRFQKNIENRVAAISLHFIHYNFVRIHQTLRITPAMAAGVTDGVWEVADIVALVEVAQAEREANAYGLGDSPIRLKR